jgi:hypothetical protein
VPQRSERSDSKNRHPLIVNTLRYRKSRPSRAASPEAIPEDDVLQISVSLPGQDRVFRLLNALFNAAVEKGYTVAVDKRKGSKGAIIYVGDQPVGVSLKEHLKQVPHVPTKQELEQAKKYSWVKIPPFDLEPSGELTFIVENVWAGRNNWSGGKRWKQEDRIPAILAGIEQAAVKLREHRLERERAEMERLEREHRAEEERRCLELLQQQIRTWHWADEVRAFVAAVRAQIEEQRASRHIAEGVDEYLAWALAYTDRVDPRATILSGGSRSPVGQSWLLSSSPRPNRW